jgi:hypothetical protein
MALHIAGKQQDLDLDLPRNSAASSLRWRARYRPSLAAYVERVRPITCWALGGANLASYHAWRTTNKVRR